MDYDEDKIDEVVLALLYRNLHNVEPAPISAGRAWKSLDWDALDRLHEKGLISNPRSKTKSVVLDADGIEKAEAACRRLFGAAEQGLAAPSIAPADAQAASAPASMAAEAQQVWAGLEFRKPAMLRLVEPLTPEQMRWRPAPDRNSVAWQLWHIAEVEDNWVRDKLLGEAKRYPFGRSVRNAADDDYPDKPTLLRYLDEVRALTRQRLERLTPSDFTRRFHDERFGELSMHDLWAGLVTSSAWHTGQIALTVGLVEAESWR